MVPTTIIGDDGASAEAGLCGSFMGGVDLALIMHKPNLNGIA